MNEMIRGTAAGVPFLARPPEQPTSTTPLVVGWHLVQVVERRSDELSEDRKKIAAEIQTVMYDQAPGIPWGQFAQPAAYRANLRGLIPSAIPIFWNIEK